MNSIHFSADPIRAPELIDIKPEIFDSVNQFLSPVDCSAYLQVFINTTITYFYHCYDLIKNMDL